MAPATFGVVKAKPKDYEFPMKKTAVLIQKMQREFLDEGGFGSLLGNDVSVLKPVIPMVKSLILAARSAGVEVIFTKEAHKADLSDVPPSKSRRTLNRSLQCITIGDEGPLGRVLVEGEPGNEIVSDCSPLPGEKVFTSPAKGLYNTGIHEYCIKNSISHIIIAGVTTDVGVQLLMREFNDRGFEPCLVEDCTGSYFEGFKEASFEMIVAQGGIIGWTTTLEALQVALSSPVTKEPDDIPEWIPSTVPKLLKPDNYFPFPAPAAPPEYTRGQGWAVIQNAKPIPFGFPVEKTAVVVIDMQRDFILEGGFGSTLGNNVKLLQDIVPNVTFLLNTCRKYKVDVIHTLESHKADLSDCPLAKLTRGGLPEGLRIGDKGDMGRILVQREWGNEIVDENAPLPSEKAIFKPGKGAFFGTDLHPYLLKKGITHLLFAGVTTEVCVQTSMREATDRGFECAIIEDCTESYFPHFKKSTIEILTAQGAIVGWSVNSQGVLEALEFELGPK